MFDLGPTLVVFDWIELGVFVVGWLDFQLVPQKSRVKSRSF